MDWDISVAVKQGGEMRFFNKYVSKSQEDTLYYILLAYQSHDLDPHVTTLSLSGLVKEGSPLHELIFAYVKDIRFNQSGERQFADEPPAGYAAHYYSNLFSLIG